SDEMPVRYDLAGGIATIVIDRPHRKNALSVAAANALTDCWRRVEDDDPVTAAILTSSDCSVSSAGLDFKEAAEIRARDGGDILTLMTDPMHERMCGVTKPIIAAVTGSLMAGGMLLSLQRDLRGGLKGTKAGIAEVKVGRQAMIQVRSARQVEQEI
ncbi:MAG: enoyl-CoA hydratase/isomerase family protein, partial [Rhizobiaceae bacterium]